MTAAVAKTPPAWLIRFRIWKRKVRESISILMNLPNLYHGQRRDHEATVKALRSTTEALNQLHLRLRWYEHRVPMIRKEFAAFKARDTKTKKKETKLRRERRGNPDNPVPLAGVPEIERAEMGVTV